MTSKRHLRRKQCGDKIRHETETEAKRARHNMHVTGWRMNVYKCRFCGSWHVGHAPKPKPQRHA